MRLTRRRLIGSAGAAALSAAGIYELVDKIGTAPRRRPSPYALPPEQHILDGVRLVLQEGVEVLVPPLHHQVVTAKVGVASSPGSCGRRKARSRRRSAISSAGTRRRPPGSASRSPGPAVPAMTMAVHERRERSLHVRRAASVQVAVAKRRRERVARPVVERAGRHDIGVSGEADHRRRVAATRPQVGDAVDNQRLAAKSKRREARGDQSLAAGVVGRQRAAGDQRARERERRRSRRCPCGDGSDRRRRDGARRRRSRGPARSASRAAPD